MKDSVPKIFSNTYIDMNNISNPFSHLFFTNGIFNKYIKIPAVSLSRPNLVFRYYKPHFDKKQSYATNQKRAPLQATSTDEKLRARSLSLITPLVINGVFAGLSKAGNQTHTEPGFSRNSNSGKVLRMVSRRHEFSERKKSHIIPNENKNSTELDYIILDDVDGGFSTSDNIMKSESKLSHILNRIVNRVSKYDSATGIDNKQNNNHALARKSNSNSSEYVSDLHNPSDVLKSQDKGVMSLFSPPAFNRTHKNQALEKLFDSSKNNQQSTRADILPSIKVVAHKEAVQKGGLKTDYDRTGKTSLADNLKSENYSDRKSVYRRLTSLTDDILKRIRHFSGQVDQEQLGSAYCTTSEDSALPDYDKPVHAGALEKRRKNIKFVLKNLDPNHHSLNGGEKVLATSAANPNAGKNIIKERVPKLSVLEHTKMSNVINRYFPKNNMTLDIAELSNMIKAKNAAASKIRDYKEHTYTLKTKSKAPKLMLALEPQKTINHNGSSTGAVIQRKSIISGNNKSGRSSTPTVSNLIFFNRLPGSSPSNLTLQRKNKIGSRSYKSANVASDTTPYSQKPITSVGNLTAHASGELDMPPILTPLSSANSHQIENIFEKVEHRYSGAPQLDNRQDFANVLNEGFMKGVSMPSHTNHGRHSNLDFYNTEKIFPGVETSNEYALNIASDAGYRSPPIKSRYNSSENYKHDEVMPQGLVFHTPVLNLEPEYKSVKNSKNSHDYNDIGISRDSDNKQPDEQNSVRLEAEFISENKGITQPSVEAIASKVYRMLERKLSIERERRGIF